MFRQADAFLTGVVALGMVLMTAILAGTVGCAGLPLKGGSGDEQTVTAEGWAPVDARDMEGTRRRALADAQRKAVEQVSGVAVAALLRVEDAMTRREKLTAQVRGFVSRYDILGESTDGGFCKVRIRARVRRGDPPHPMSPPPSDARLYLAVQGRGVNDEDWGGSATAAIRRELVARGFEVAGASFSGPGTSNALPAQVSALPSGEDGPESAASAALPELSLRGEASAVPVLDARLGAFHSSLARVSLRAVDARSGTVVWENIQEASALDLDPSGASLKAAEAAGTLLGRQAVNELPELLWKRL